ncbi:hypothetical protein FNF29_07229 [Cafeteria roenbergensis]|uniref:Uncharacterized protein n=1 Tax=Cafeteria roenbergensis TaxID=33653 RepID=A0A5A8C3P5_CAFRO|nr:hypothetical protein FNF29_07229 [Cafeteria roenbergensis]|eukprot:KAA0147676.1 hypothetical protein FNF29_07229 [Cafeteria roenbergensis]
MFESSIRIAPADGLAQLRSIVVARGLDARYKPSPPARAQPREATAEDLFEARVWERAERVLPSDEWAGTEYEDALFWLDAAGAAYREQLLWALANRGADVSGAEDVQQLRVRLYTWCEEQLSAEAVGLARADREWRADLSNSQGVFAFGANDEGQLGLGHRLPRSRPTAVVSLFAVDVAELRAAPDGLGVTAVTTDGEAYVWGSAGRIGDGPGSVPGVVLSPARFPQARCGRRGQR